MECLEPELTPEELEDVESWFCPLCTAHGNLIHFAQSEHLGDEWECSRVQEWETAGDVFPEAEFETRVAHKFKEDVMDDETKGFLEDTMGIVVGGSSSDKQNNNYNNFELGPETEEEEEDDDFDQYEENVEDSESLAEDNEEERRLVKETIEQDEMDALSVTSGGGGSDSEDDENDEGFSAITRRSRRKKFTCSIGSTIRSEKSGNEEEDECNGRSSARPDADIGALDVTNIVRGKRRRTKVNYRKLADVMFGDESDEEAKGVKNEYIYNTTEVTAKTRQKKKTCRNDDNGNKNGNTSNEDTLNKNDTMENTQRCASRKGRVVKENSPNEKKSYKVKAPKSNRVDSPEKRNGQNGRRK